MHGSWPSCLVHDSRPSAQPTTLHPIPVLSWKLAGYLARLIVLTLGNLTCPEQCLLCRMHKLTVQSANPQQGYQEV